MEEHDKESFKMNLNHILCCRPWDILPDILDKFEIINEGKDISHYMKKMLGKRIGEAFMPLRESLVSPPQNATSDSEYAFCGGLPNHIQ